VAHGYSCGRVDHFSDAAVGVEVDLRLGSERVLEEAWLRGVDVLKVEDYRRSVWCSIRERNA
jgi:hypothetical protein